MKKQIDREKNICHLIDRIEVLDHTVERNNILSINLLNSIIDDYYLNDFNQGLIDDEVPSLDFVLIEKIRNANRSIRLLMEYMGITEDNNYKINLMADVITKITEKDNIYVRKLYDEVKDKFGVSNK